MTELLLIAPNDWEKATPEMLNILIENTGNLTNIQSIIDQGLEGLSQLHIMDEERLGITVVITQAIIIEGNLWFKVTPI